MNERPRSCKLAALRQFRRIEKEMGMMVAQHIRSSVIGYVALFLADRFEHASAHRPDLRRLPSQRGVRFIGTNGTLVRVVGPADEWLTTSALGFQANPHHSVSTLVSLAAGESVHLEAVPAFGGSDLEVGGSSGQPAHLEMAWLGDPS